ncbi:hypothetical protein EJ03DRAFT_346828 [Teratosphaeria nubilosa]|uniref:BTB domain-containing protein n=1 Tax=Teratosphaeria nubilosa TaxID=161662 RepID=A0A6G1LMR9_9PEZI|nr:hypothetical protein EJ03DRAFT_346828 [Teratosphaeria nubilosa]
MDEEVEEASSKVRTSNRLAPDFSGNIIMVQVGDGGQMKSFSVHEALLVKHSEYFRMMLGEEWRESTTCTHVVPMPEDDPASFELFAGFVYTGKVFSDAPSSATGVSAVSTEQDDDAEEFERLARAWALGEKLMSITLKDAVTDATINKIYTTKPGDSSTTDRGSGAPSAASPLSDLRPTPPPHAGPPHVGPPPAGPPFRPFTSIPAGSPPLRPLTTLPAGLRPTTLPIAFSPGSPSPGNFPTNMHSIVWSHSATAKVGMKKLLVNVAVSQWDAEAIKEMRHDDGVPKEFLWDVLVGIKESWVSLDFQVLLGNQAGCQYHEHLSAGGCYRSMFRW